MRRGFFVGAAHASGRGAPPLPSWIKGMRASQLVAYSRLAVAFFALIATYADPSQPARYIPVAYYLLATFVFYSGILALASERAPARGYAAFLIHVTDIGFFSAFAFLTEGPTSPFVLFFTFALFTGTIRWGWSGAAGTALATVFIYWGLAATARDGFQEEVSFIIIRGGYQIFAGVLFSYFGAILELERQRLADLAAWPGVPASHGDFPYLPLEHVASVMGADRALAVWEDRYEPHLLWTEHGPVGLQRGEARMSLRDAFDAVADIREAVVLSSDPAPGQHRVPVWLMTEFQITGAVIAPMGGDTEGFLVLVGERALGDETAALARIAALQLAIEIERHEARQQERDASADQARSDLMRDIHDDLLQSLAAVRLQLERLEQDQPPGHACVIADLRHLVTKQQVGLRQLIIDHRTSIGRHVSGRILGDLVPLIRSLEMQWGCLVDLKITPLPLSLAPTETHSIKMFISEAIANGVRHGKADRFVVDLRKDESSLVLLLSDNGAGLPHINGLFEHEVLVAQEVGSSSLLDRAVAAGGRMSLRSSGDGVEVTLRIDHNGA